MTANKEKRSSTAIDAETRYRITLACVGDAVISTDEQGCVDFLNPVAERLTGWTEVDARGRPLDEVFRIVNEETRAAVESPVDRVLREGRAVGLANHTLLISRDGTERPIADSGAPIRDADDNVTGVVLVFRDQTEERAVQRRCRELFDDVAVGLLRFTPGPEGTFIDVNPAMVEMFEADSREQLMAVRPDDIYLDSGQRRIVSNVLMSTGFIKDEVRCKTLKGNAIWCRITGVKRTAANGQIYFDSTIEDITDRKQAEAALREKEKTLEERNELLQQRSAALRELIVQLKTEQMSLEKQVRANIDQLIRPVLQKAKETSQLPKIRGLLEIIDTNLRGITSSFGAVVENDWDSLSRREVEVSQMIRDGLSSKRIAELLGISYRSVTAHRENIRRKLGLKARKINLSTYLRKFK